MKPPLDGARRYATPVAVGLLALVVLIGALSAPGHAWFGLDQRWSRRIFDLGDHGWVRDLWRIAGRATEPWVWRLVTAVGVVLLWRRGWRASAFWWAAVMTTAGVAGIVVKLVVARARPDWPGSLVHLDGYTFPSGHATNIAAFVLSALVVLWAVIGRRARVLAATCGSLLVLGVGADRVLLGVHHVSDVLAGWALGTAVVLAAVQFLPKPD